MCVYIIVRQYNVNVVICIAYEEHRTKEAMIYAAQQRRPFMEEAYSHG